MVNGPMFADHCLQFLDQDAVSTLTNLVGTLTFTVASALKSVVNVLDKTKMITPQKESRVLFASGVPFHCSLASALLLENLGSVY